MVSGDGGMESDVNFKLKNESRKSQYISHRDKGYYEKMDLEERIDGSKNTYVIACKYSDHLKRKTRLQCVLKDRVARGRSDS